MSQTMEIAGAKESFLADFARMEEEWGRDGGSWLAPARKRAIERFAALGFPTARSEAWRHASLAALQKIAFAPAPAAGREIAPERLREFVFGEESGCRLVFVNGRWAEGLSRTDGLPPGAVAGSLREAIEREDAHLRGHLARHASFEGHPFVALNTAFIEDGAFVYLPKGARAERPIHLLHIASAPEGEIAVHPRTLIVAGESCEAAILESHRALGEEAYLTNAVTELVAGANSSLSHGRLQLESERAFHFATLHVAQERDSEVRSQVATLGGRQARNETTAILDGEGARCELDGLYMIRGEQRVDHVTRVEHAKPRGSSFQLYKGIAGGRASGDFNGHILVRPGAQKTDAKQSSAGLVLSREARANAEPRLEIYADDVRCTHGAAIGQLDANALFYLRTRGIDAESARGVLAYAFANEVIAKFEIDAVRRELERIALERFARDRREGARA